MPGQRLPSWAYICTPKSISAGSSYSKHSLQSPETLNNRKTVAPHRGNVNDAAVFRIDIFSHFVSMPSERVPLSCSSPDDMRAEMCVYPHWLSRKSGKSFEFKVAHLWLRVKNKDANWGSDAHGLLVSNMLVSGAKRTQPNKYCWGGLIVLHSGPFGSSRGKRFYYHQVSCSPSILLLLY